MKVLVLGLNYAPEAVGIGIYTTGLAEGLAAAGHQVRVIAGQPYYPEWLKRSGFRPFSQRMENGVQVLRVPHFVPRRPTGARRIVHHLSFGLASLFPAFWSALTWRPDIVLAVAPSLVSAPIGKVCAFVSGGKAWLHVQDFEIDAATAVGLLGPTAGRIARWLEKLSSQGFDRVSTISPAMCQRLVDKGIPAERVSEVRNWADPSTATLFAPSPFREKWHIGAPHVALYSGTISNKQGLEIVLDAARRLRARSDLTFVICGTGPTRAALQRQAADLPNVRFFNQQPVDDLNNLLGLATVHLLPQRQATSDLLFPSKLANIMASGRPVVATAVPGSDLARTVQDCGLVTPPEDAQAFAGAIERLLDDQQLWVECAHNGRARSATQFNKTAILAHLECEMQHLTGAAGIPVLL